MSSSVEYLDHLGTDLTVVNAARVSFGRWKDVMDERDFRLIQYLARHGHESPFYHCIVSLRIMAPLYVARQLFRHEVGGAKNEVSRRYVTGDPVIALPRTIYAKADGGNKQGDGQPAAADTAAKARSVMAALFDQAQCAYRELVQLGVSPGQARIVLPMAASTSWVWTGSLAFFARVCRLRLGDEAQCDTGEVAEQIDGIMRGLFPAAWPALMSMPTPTAQDDEDVSFDPVQQVR